MDVLRPGAVMFCLLFSLAEGNPTGPPVATNPGICETMLPSHGATKQTSIDMFNITLGNDCYKEGHIISVTVESDEKFKGIFVQARKTAGTIQNNDPEGTFEAGSSSNMKALECNNVTASAWGHSQRLDSKSVNFNWKAPSNRGDIKLVMTIVKEQVVFWTFQQSGTIKYKADCVEQNGSSRSISAVSYALLTAVMAIAALLH